MTTPAQFVTEAESWTGTPYEMNQACKGAGADCGRFIYQALVNCGMVSPEAQKQVIEIFDGTWSSCTDDKKYQRYIFRMLRNARKILEGISYPTLKALPGCIVLTKLYGSRVEDHGGIVVDWPMIIHAVPPKITKTDASQHWIWANKTVEVFDPFGERT
jgi:cell wall-associated NlpC family hydrolase